MLALTDGTGHLHHHHIRQTNHRLCCPPHPFISICNKKTTFEPPDVTEEDLLAAVQPFVSICNRRIGFRPLGVTDRDFSTAVNLPSRPVTVTRQNGPLLLQIKTFGHPRTNPSRSVTVTDLNRLQTLQIKTNRQRHQPLLPFLLIDIERLDVPPLGSHDVANQAQVKADARGVETVL